MTANELKQITDQKLEFPLCLDDIFAFLRADALSGDYSSKFGKVAISETNIDNLRCLGYEVTVNGSEILINWKNTKNSNENYEVRRG